MSVVASRWSAVVVNYNAGEHLAACVESLLNSRDDRLAEIIVIDNGSTDNSLTMIEHLDARIVHASGNLGYARAANLGIAISTSPYVAVLNADIVVDPVAGRQMCTALDAETSRGAVGPRIRNQQGADYPSARQIPSLATSIGHFVVGMVRPSNRWTRKYRQADLDPDTGRTADWVSGATMLFRRSALDSIGGWDERYFMFLEDVDICVRLRADGWTVWYEPSATVMHVEGVSRRSHPYRTIADHHRSALRFADAHWRGPRRLLLGPVACALLGRAILLVAVGWLRPRLQR